MGLRLREIRKSRKASQESFARILGVATSTYCKYEHHAIPITAHQVQTLAQELRIPIEAFFSDALPQRNAQEEPCTKSHT